MPYCVVGKMFSEINIEKTIICDLNFVRLCLYLPPVLRISTTINLKLWCCNKIVYRLSAHLWQMMWRRAKDYDVCLFDTIFRCCHWIISSEPQGTVKKTLLCWYLKSVWFRLSPLKSWKTQKSNFTVISSGIIISDNSHWKADIPPVRASFIMFELNQLDCYKKRHPRCCYPQYSITYRTHPRTPNNLPSCPNLLESLCMALSLFPQPIEVKITVGCERAEWLYISKITVGIYHCHWDTPTRMNWVKWEHCIGQGALTVTNAPPVATNRSVQISRGS